MWWFSYFFSLSVELVGCCVECLALEFSKLVLVLRFRCRGGAARWCKEGGAGAEMQVQRLEVAQSIDV